jgi:hypothetical protein
MRGAIKLLSLMGVAVLVIALFVLSPYCLIWSLNQLFSLHIVYNVVNWLAAFFLLAVFGRTSYNSNNKK